MRPFWIICTWLAIMISVIWGTHSLSGHGHEAGDSVEDETFLADFSGPWLLPLAPTRNNREDALRELGLYPCRDCHNLLVTNPSKREEFAKPHEHIGLAHGEATGCLTCHSDGNRDQLILLDGTEVSFNESHRVCGGCHGPIYRDWKNGVHGLRTGYWNGEKKVWVCVRCHHPHGPKYAPMAPLPPPLRDRSEHAAESTGESR